MTYFNHSEDQEKPGKALFRSAVYPLSFVVLIWIIKIVEVIGDIRLVELGVFPRQVKGLTGIICSPLLHGDFNHLINNSVSFLILGTGLFYFYRAIAVKVWFWVWLMSGLWLWSIGRPSWHIGASGLIYGFSSFIFFSGVIRKHIRLLALSLLVVFLYGSMVWGIFPVDHTVSWEGHLFGAMAGFLLALYYRNTGPRRKVYSWELEEDEEEMDDDQTRENDDDPEGDIKITYDYREN